MGKGVLLVCDGGKTAPRVVKGLGQVRWPVVQSCVRGQEAQNVVRGCMRDDQWPRVV